MKLLKRILTLTLLLICTVLVVIIVACLLVDDATVVSQIVAQLESSSDIRVLSRGAVHITRTLKPTLAVEDLVITDTGRQYRVETASLEVQVGLLKLLLGQLDIPYVAIGDTRINIKEGLPPDKPAAAPEPKTGPRYSPLPLKPILRDIRISQLKITYEGGAVLIPESHVRDCTMALNPDNDLEIRLKVGLFDQDVDVNAVLEDVDDYFGGQPLGFSLGLQNPLCHLLAQGHIDFDRPDPTIKAAVRAWTADGEKIAVGRQRMVIPGRLTGEAQLNGTFAKLDMEQITATWHGPDQSSVHLTGRTANVFGLDGVQLNLSGKLRNPAWLTPLLPENLGALKNAVISAEISGDYPRLSVNNFGFQGKTADELDLSMSGQFDLAYASTGLEPVNIHVELAFGAPKTRAARVLFWETIAEFGAITGRCDIRSTVGDPTVENIAVQTKDASGIQANLTGRIAEFPLTDRPNSGYHMDVAMKATNTAVMAERVGMHLPLQGPMDLHFRIEGSTEALILDKILFDAGDEHAVRITADGALSFGDWDQTDPYETIDLHLNAKSHTTHAIGTLLGKELPELGPLFAKAYFHTVSGQHRLDELLIETGKNAPLAAVVSGTATRVTLVPELRVEDIKLIVNAGTDDTGKLNTVFGLRNRVPPIGSLKAQARISGNDQNLAIDDLSMVAGHEDILQVSLTGRLGNLSASNQWQLEKTNLAINASSVDSRAFAAKMGYQIPELGPLFAQANLFEKKKMVSMDSARLWLGDRDNPVVKATGHIHDLTAMEGVKWDAQLDLDGRRFAAFADFHKLSELGALTGQLSISDSDGTLGLDSFHVETDQPTWLSLKLDGSFKNFKDPSTLRLKSNLTARDLQLIGAIFDREWPAVGPVRLDTEIKGTGNGNDLNSMLTAGETEIETQLNARFKTTPMQINGTVTARRLFAWDVLAKARHGENKETSTKTPVFSREPIDLEWLKKIDMDIAIDVKSFGQESHLAESAQFHVAANSGHLSISPGRLVYPKGNLDMDLQLDARRDPQLTFQAHGENLDPWQTLYIQESRRNVEADLDIDMSISSWGFTPHELASNSQGSIYITLQNGKLSTALADLVFVDIAGWAWHKTTGKTFYDIDCGVVDCSIENGILTTDALIIDTKSVAITGDGTIDLGREEIEYVLLPEKKSSIIHRADPVKIEGPLNAPSVKTIPWKSAVTTYSTYGGMILAPFIFVPLAAADRVAGSLKGKDANSPCLEYQQAHKKEIKGRKEGMSVNK